MIPVNIFTDYVGQFCICYYIHIWFMSVLLMYDTDFTVFGGKDGRIYIEYGNRSFIKVIHFLSIDGGGEGEWGVYNR